MNAPNRITRLSVLGSTGSIGTQTLEIVRAHPDRFEVVALAAKSNRELLARQEAEFKPSLVAFGSANPTEEGGSPLSWLPGEAGLLQAATHPDAEIVVVATSGHAAIVPTLAAIDAGKTIALANKEVIVCAGEIIMPRARARGVDIRPVDSEHSAIWQSLGQAHSDEIERLILTASGGPFRDWTLSQLSTATVTEALAHPTWSMGGKITVDSATLMNKGLEVIEAHWLFGVAYDLIDVVVHPESVVHSLVEFRDGGVIAQLSLPDMRLPIQYALTFPDRIGSDCRKLSLTEIGTLSFLPPDQITFPALRLAREAGVAGTSYPTALSAADEVAVAAFLDGRIRFTVIAEVVERVLQSHQPAAIDGIDAILATDAAARIAASDEISRLTR